MGRFDKRIAVVAWLRRVHDDNEIVTRTFFTEDELFSLYQSTRNNDDLDLSSESFKRLIRSIYRSGMFDNLKRKEVFRHKENGYIQYSDILLCIIQKFI